MPAGKEFDACGVCGRTILRGERTTEYATPDGARVVVCALCRPAIESAGWIPADRIGKADYAAAARRRRPGLRERLWRVSEAARARTARPAREAESSSEGEGSPERPERGARRSGEPAAGDEAPRKKGQRSTPRRVREEREGEGEEPSPERRLRKGVERFNASSQPRKVAGLMRSLGKPHVAVRAGSGDRVLVTVAWELSWYQWRVDAEEEGPVREAGKGSEVSELALRDRSWNAQAQDDGRVRLVAVREASREGA